MSASATLVRPPMTSVPREFVGQARRFRSALKAEDADALVKSLGLACAVRGPLARGNLPRPDLLAETAAAWREDIPTNGSCGWKLRAGTVGL